MRERERERERVVIDGGGRGLKTWEGRRRQAEKGWEIKILTTRRDPVRSDRIDRVTSFSL